MGVTYLKIKVQNPTKPKLSLERRFLVDSGATYSVLPEEELDRLKIKPIDSQRFMLANGEEVEKKIGEARFTWRDKTRTVPVIFGEKNVYLLGATTLESLGLILDPLSREIKPLPMLI
jgi:clan AA aspartic protease